MKKETGQKYFIEIIHNENNSETNYYITKGYQGFTIMIFSPAMYRVISEKGWIETPHTGFEKVEIASNQTHVMVYYVGIKNPQTLEIPSDADSAYYELTDIHIEQALIQMKLYGLSFDDFWAEYYEGINTVYSYDCKKQSFIVTLVDVIVGSFFREIEISEAEMKERLKECASMNSLRENGFVL